MPTQLRTRAEIRREIATMIHQARTAANLSQQELAAMLHLARSQLSAWENAKRPIYAEDLICLLEICGTDQPLPAAIINCPPQPLPSSLKHPDVKDPTAIPTTT